MLTGILECPLCHLRTSKYKYKTDNIVAFHNHLVVVHNTSLASLVGVFLQVKTMEIIYDWWKQYNDKELRELYERLNSKEKGKRKSVSL